ncbi:DUF4468 domain-containing protein [Hymenobacter pini]|uniref:DUF4468 domain-containing protein n=1 Tax=Hymenobacter pini TaxID=2880879 RepID=UPI001CF2CAA5|nr:DUF4468 domain-containing protein [Hymenobacter pini]MCA8830802.1 DUF4468 domain-containing protein [Hymenobacter pini]
MRTLYCFIGLAFASIHVSQAQQPKAAHAPRTYLVGGQPLALHFYLTDTAQATTITLPAGSNATVVGSQGRNWAIVKKEQFLYYAPATGLLDFKPLTYEAAEQAAVGPFPIDATTQHITYQGVVEVPGVTKDELYTRAYEWMAKNYRSANAVIQMHDKEAGRLVGKGATVMETQRLSGLPSYVRHTLSIYVKDNRYKYVLTDFEYVSGVTTLNGMVKTGPLEQENLDIAGGTKRWEKVRSETKRDSYMLTTSLQEAMMPSKGKDTSDF